MLILALDPGSEQTAWVQYNPTTKHILTFGYDPNIIIAEVITDSYEQNNIIACEHIQCLGMAVGKSVFETCYWIGEFRAHCRNYHKLKFERIYRSEEKMHLCGSMKAKDSNIRQALIDKFPATGGGKCPQVGTKKQPGPLYGISGDLWSALAVAVTYAETKL